MEWIPRHLRYGAVLACASTTLLVSACSTSASSPVAVNTIGPPAMAKRAYLLQVNHLCDRLLPQVLKATQGGSLDIPAHQYLADWPAHQRAERAFDRSLAAVWVPPAATHASAAMAAYVRFADHLDAARLRAARAGEAAWRREVAREKNVESSPVIAARDAAGFAGSCDSR